ncbi:hypothetical protein AGDE_10214 [Angomonas deanei]|uniref:Region in Clathrin and VPS, putative n=1 Tax=Angomonas deanei TaxID=59799 RepID=A0A7G2C0L0_9TRYP|nr:hypothetical protein AGDE_10214 [Angomonas deanei]CAD2213065.1 Region in Clathrin and VPS, putative [Angomonas deanei]|eukprot:EPY28923.1 hypothetical protein AGDE_10214 [Angomonas deanei]
MVDAVIDEVEAALAIQSSGAKTGESVLHFHSHIALQRELKRIRASMGYPTCIALLPLVIKGVEDSVEKDIRLKVAIGTSSGAIVLYDAKWNSLGVCAVAGSRQSGAKLNVSALSISSDAVTMVSGHLDSTIVLWSVEQRSAIRTIRNEFTSMITRVKYFPGQPYKFVSLDAGGSLKVMQFTKVFSKAISRVTLVADAYSGQVNFDLLAFPSLAYLTRTHGVPHVEGSVKSIVPALYTHSDPTVSVENRLLLASISFDTVCLFDVEAGISTSTTLVGKHTNPSLHKPSSECVAFSVKDDGDTVISLCCLWKTKLDVLHLLFDSSTGVCVGLQPVNTIPLDNSFVCLIPILSNNLVLVDTSGVICLLDTLAGEVVESHALEDLTFLQVVKDLPSVPNSFASNYEEVLLIGLNSAYTCSLLPWNTRLDTLLLKKNFTRAINLAIDLYTEVAFSVVGLSSSKSARRQALQVYVEKIAVAYLQHTVQFWRRDEQRIRACLSQVIYLCSQVDAQSVLFSSVAAFTRENKMTNLFFLELEAALLSEDITTLPEAYIFAFFFFFEDTKALAASEGKAVTSTLPGVQRAENALLHVRDNLETLLELADQKQLHTLKMTVLSLRLGQFREALAYGLQPSNHKERGVVVSEYVEKTLHDKTFLPNVELPVEVRVTAKQELLTDLIDPKNPRLFYRLLSLDGARWMQSLLSTLSAVGDAFAPFTGRFMPVDIYISCVIHFVGAPADRSASDTPVSVFSKSASERATVGQFFSPEFLSNKNGNFSRFHEFLDGLVNLLLVNKPLCYAMEKRHADWRFFTALVVEHYTFLFHNASSHDDRCYYEKQLTRFLYFPPCAKLHSVLEQFDDEFTDRGMHRCLAVLYCRNGKYNDAIQCYLNKDHNTVNPHLAEDVFPMVRREMEIQTVNCDGGAPGAKDNLSKLRSAVLENVSDLVRVDAAQLAQLIFDYLPSKHHEVLKILRGSTTIFLKYLDELTSKNDTLVATDITLQNSYIELLCANQPERVYPHLKNQQNLITYDIQNALRSAKKYHVSDALVYLLSKTQQLDDAMSVLSDSLFGYLKVVRQVIVSPLARTTTSANNSSTSHNISLTDVAEEEDPKEKAVQQLRHMVDVGLEFCAGVKPSERANVYWFRLINCVVCPQRLLGEWLSAEKEGDPLSTGSDGEGDPSTSPILTESELDATQRYYQSTSPADMMQSEHGAAHTLALRTLPYRLSDQERQVVKAMLDVYASFTSLILGHLVKESDPSLIIGKILGECENNSFAVFRPILTEVMSTLSFELELNRLSLLCAEDDVFSLGHNLYNITSRGVIPISDSCYICGLALQEESTMTATTSAKSGTCVFVCGHAYHEKCRAAVSGNSSQCYQCTINNGGTVHWEGNPNPKGEKAEPPSETAVDANYMQRRLRQTRAKLNRVSTNYYDTLKALLVSNGADDRSHEKEHKTVGSKKLLSPPPKFPKTVQQKSEESSLDLTADDAAIEKLTDEEILAIFGV